MMGSGFGGMMGSGFGGWGGSGLLGGFSMVLMSVIPLLLTGLVIWAIVAATQRGDGHPTSMYNAPLPGSLPIPANQAPASARALLDERYARGEIEREEYLQRRGDMG